MSGADDRAVISTADDAALAKLSAVRAGYLDDDFACPMSAGSSGLRGAGGRGGGTTTEPLIRRGTHARVAAVDRAVDAFLSAPTPDGRRQVVVLGAGRDTSYLRRRFGGGDGGRGTLLPPATDWYEVDHPSVVREKAMRWLPRCVPAGHRYQFDETVEGAYSIDISEDGRAAEAGGTERRGGYHLVGRDLRDSPSGLFGALCACGYDPSSPALFVLECVLMYLPEDSARSLLSGIASSPAGAAGSASVVAYDPVPGGGRFGNLMVDNLRRALGAFPGGRGGGDGSGTAATARLSLETTRTLSDQLGRLADCGFRSAAGCDMMDAYSCGVVTEEERGRAARCEMLDELEEFELLMRHYCLVVGVATAGGEDGGGGDGALGLCSVGEDSPVGFREGRCSVMRS